MLLLRWWAWKFDVTPEDIDSDLQDNGWLDHLGVIELADRLHRSPAEVRDLSLIAGRIPDYLRPCPHNGGCGPWQAVRLGAAPAPRPSATASGAVSSPVGLGGTGNDRDRDRAGVERRQLAAPDMWQWHRPRIRLPVLWLS